MNEIDKNKLLELINKYGIDELEKVIDINREILNYIQETKKTYTLNEQPRNLVYNEDKDKQIFTNSRTSIFCLNEKILNFDKLKLNPELSSKQITIVKQDGINKYFDISKKYFGNSYSSVSLINDKGFTYYKDLGEINTISLNEYKLIKLLLKNPKIYAACQTIIYAKGENGFAYVLGENKGRQLIF